MIQVMNMVIFQIIGYKLRIGSIPDDYVQIMNLAVVCTVHLIIMVKIRNVGVFLIIILHIMSVAVFMMFTV
jgi:hypothetical protein